MCVCMWLYARACCAWRDQKRVTDPLELKLQMTVSHMRWILEPNSDVLEVKFTLLTPELLFQPPQSGFCVFVCWFDLLQQSQVD